MKGFTAISSSSSRKQQLVIGFRILLLLPSTKCIEYKRSAPKDNFLYANLLVVVERCDGVINYFEKYGEKKTFLRL